MNANVIDAPRNRLRSIGQVDAKSNGFVRKGAHEWAVDTYSTYYPFYVGDDEVNNFWCSNSWCPTHPWLTLDLESPVIVTKSRFVSGIDGTQYKIEVSNDNINWLLVYTSGTVNNFAEDIYYPPCLRYTYWRYTHVAGGTYGWVVRKVYLYGPVV